MQINILPRNKFHAYERLLTDKLRNRKNTQLLIYHFSNLKKYRSLEKSKRLLGPLELVPLKKVYEDSPKTQFDYEKDFINPKTVQKTLTAYGIGKLFEKIKSDYLKT